MKYHHIQSTSIGISTSCRSVLIFTCLIVFFSASEIKELEEQRDAVKLEDESSVRVNSLCHISLFMVLACLCLPFLLMSDPSLLHLGMNSSFDMCPACICSDQRLPLPLTHLVLTFVCVFPQIASYYQLKQQLTALSKVNLAYRALVLSWIMFLATVLFCSLIARFS